MPYGMYISAEGAKVQAQRLEVLANNLANVDTVGFKRDVPTFQARFAEAIQQGLAQAGDESTNDVGGGVKTIETHTDFSAGTLQHTEKPLDFAIAGDGFFQVADAAGETYLTRAGDFLLDTQGRLTTMDGNHFVLDQSGGPIQINSQEPWSVRADGMLVQAGSSIPLGLVRPSSLGDLAKVGSNRFRSLAPVEAVPAAERNVRQGYLEMSGADPTQQMMELIETSRAFEANTRMIQNHDSMLGSLIGRLLRAS